MSVRLLQPEDAASFQQLRLRGLRECPAAFASSFEEEDTIPIAEVAERLRRQQDKAVLGWLEDNGNLVGVVGLQRERMRKLAHKAYIWGMYVAPEARRPGIGRQLLKHALEHARRELGVIQVNLGVNVENRAAFTLYENLGFRSYGREQGFLLVNGVLHDEYQMVCRIHNDPSA